ncbi:MAG: sulfotransferase [Methylacidiphilales bacterium]|nr:sulfotransferase [Candidatus Methylacidiphilales bacterium]
MHTTNLKDTDLLIIGGMPKAGTTSLFNWLSKHPDIAASVVKETRFFLDKDYPLPSSARYNGKNLEDYIKYFRHNSDAKLLLESTPDYLYCRTPIHIADIMPRAKFIFVLRDPVERAVSWYKFAAQLGYLPRKMSFTDYIQAQLGKSVYKDTPIYLRALDQNRLNKYLPHFLEAYGSRCKVFDFAQLKTDPYSIVSEICKFCGIEPSFYDNFVFDVKNISTGVHAARHARIYYRTRAWFIYTFRPSPKTKNMLRPIASSIKKILSASQFAHPIELSQDIIDAIRSDAQIII